MWTSLIPKNGGDRGDVWHGIYLTGPAGQRLEGGGPHLVQKSAPARQFSTRMAPATKSREGAPLLCPSSNVAVKSGDMLAMKELYLVKRGRLIEVPFVFEWKGQACGYCRLSATIGVRMTSSPILLPRVWEHCGSLDDDRGPESRCPVPEKVWASTR
jgi:hypothetical protein